MNGFRAMLGKELQALYTSPLAWAVDLALRVVPPPPRLIEFPTCS